MGWTIIRAIRLDPENAGAFNNRGIAWYDKKEYDKAIADYNEAIRLDPKSPTPTTTAARLVRQEGLRQGDRRLQRGHPARSEVRRRLSQPRHAWCDKKEYDKAIADYNEAIRLDPKMRHAFNNRGHRLVRQEGVRQGDRRLQRGHPARSRSTPSAYNNRGRLGDKKEYDKAIADYNEAIRLDPKYAGAFNNRGNAWYDKKEYDKAIADYNEAIRLDPKIAAAFNNRGIAWYDKKEYDKAIADYNEAIRLDPSTPSPSEPRHRLGRQEGVRQGDRRLQRGHPARSEIRRRLQQPRHRLARQEGVRQGDRRLQRGHPARPQDAVPSATAAMPGTTRRNTTRRSPTTTRPSGSTRKMPSPTTTVARLAKKEYDKAIADSTSHPPRSSKYAPPSSTRGVAWRSRRSTTRRSRTTTKPSASTRNMPIP